MKVDGVREAKADYEKGWAWAKYDAAKTTPDRLVEAIKKHTPFEASLKTKD